MLSRLARRWHAQYWLSALLFGLLAVIFTLPAGAQQEPQHEQYHHHGKPDCVPPTPPGPPPCIRADSSSALPPNTDVALDDQGQLSAVVLGQTEQVAPADVADFGQHSSVLLILDESPRALSADSQAYTGADATADENDSTHPLGVVPAGTVVQPVYVRGTRVYVFEPDSASYEWLDQTH